MVNNGTIRYVPQHEIDRASWDRCIAGAPNGLVYGYTDFLDAMAVQWDGLVLGDYEAVMPLPWRKKCGVHYLYQPFLTAQLGVFGKKVDADLLGAFLKAVPKKFRLWEFPLNHGNVFPAAGFGIYRRSNFVLHLNQDYPQLHAGYRENIRRNIKKSAQYGCEVNRDLAVEAVMALALEQDATLDAVTLERFGKLFHRRKEAGEAKAYGVVSASGQLLASAAFLFSHGRAYYLLVGNHPNGRTLGASHALIDAFIHDHASSELLLDFEGSDLRNLAFFYSSFGAKEEAYAAIRQNRLPWYARWMK